MNIALILAGLFLSLIIAFIAGMVFLPELFGISKKSKPAEEESEDKDKDKL
ncbi:MAG: hypothetical protein IPJ71_12750 [Bdellovibrionales bacterium]|nr:hypothetical protein [Bdellovibrionales bacterium]